MPVNFDPASPPVANSKEQKADLKPDLLWQLFAPIADGFEREILPCELYCKIKWREIKKTSPLTKEQFEKICQSDCVALKMFANTSR